MQIDGIRLINGEALQEMDKLIREGIQVDAIICDPPYGTTACSWDSVIPFEPMWERLNKLIKPNGAIVLFGSEPFSSALRISNIKNYKYDWVWDKKIPSGMSYARFQPMRQHESISVFNSKTYYPQMMKRDKPIKSGGINKSPTAPNTMNDDFLKVYDFKNPTTIISIPKIRYKSLHPTQKPVALMEYLIKTYTNEGETVLDFTIGSGTTMVACVNTNRNGIGIELDNNYFNISMDRVAKAQKEKESKLF